MPGSTPTHVASACDTETPQLGRAVCGLNTTHLFLLFGTFKLVFSLLLLCRGFPIRACLAGREESQTKREGARSVSQTAACRRDLPDKRSQATASFICTVSGIGGAREGSWAPSTRAPWPVGLLRHPSLLPELRQARPCPLPLGHRARLPGTSSPGCDALTRQ